MVGNRKCRLCVSSILIPKANLGVIKIITSRNARASLVYFSNRFQIQERFASNNLQWTIECGGGEWTIYWWKSKGEILKNGFVWKFANCCYKWIQFNVLLIGCEPGSSVGQLKRRTKDHMQSVWFLSQHLVLVFQVEINRKEINSSKNNRKIL